ncbi:Carbohydrate esterase, partial [Globisporangium splendens]
MLHWLGGAAFLLLWAFIIHRGYPVNVLVLYTGATTAVQYLLRGGQPLFPRWTFLFELIVAVLRCISDRYGDQVVRPHWYLQVRRLSALFGDFMGRFACSKHNTEVVPVVVNGLEHLWIKAKPATSSASASNNAKTTRFVVVYYHGGGYVILCPRMYVEYCNTLRGAILKELQQTLQVENPIVDVFIANYRKAPECKFPGPAQDAVAMYKHLVRDQDLSPRQIILAGDSAGAGLVISTLIRLRNSDPSLLPLASMVLSPFADMTKESRDFEQPPHCITSSSLIEAFRTAYLKTPQDPSTYQDASAVHCDLRGLPPMFLQAATLDYLYGHSVRLAEKAKADGVSNWEPDVHEQMPHVFALFPSFVLPYALVGVNRMARFAANQFHSTLKQRKKTKSQPKEASQKFVKHIN